MRQARNQEARELIGSRVGAAKAMFTKHTSEGQLQSKYVRTLLTRVFINNDNFADLTRNRRRSQHEIPLHSVLMHSIKTRPRTQGSPCQLSLRHLCKKKRLRSPWYCRQL